MRRLMSGVVIEDKNDKTLKVSVERKYRHPFYGKVIKKDRNYYVHDEKNLFTKGDVVFFTSCRPISKTKFWEINYAKSLGRKQEKGKINDTEANKT